MSETPYSNGFMRSNNYTNTYVLDARIGRERHIETVGGD